MATEDTKFVTGPDMSKLRGYPISGQGGSVQRAVYITPTGGSQTTLCNALRSPEGTADGLPTGGVSIPLNVFVGSTGSALPVGSGAAGAFGVGLAVSSGGTITLNGEVANTATVTDTAVAMFQMPQEFIVSNSFTLNANVTLNSATGATFTSKTMSAAVFPVSGGTMQANQIATSTATIATGNLSYVVSGGNITPGQLLAIQLTGKVAESAGHNGSVVINSVSLT